MLKRTGKLIAIVAGTIVVFCGLWWLECAGSHSQKMLGHCHNRSSFIKRAINEYITQHGWLPYSKVASGSENFHSLEFDGSVTCLAADPHGRHGGYQMMTISRDEWRKFVSFTEQSIPVVWCGGSHSGKRVVVSVRRDALTQMWKSLASSGDVKMDEYGNSVTPLHDHGFLAVIQATAAAMEGRKLSPLACANFPRREFRLSWRTIRRSQARKTIPTETAIKNADIRLSALMGEPSGRCEKTQPTNTKRGNPGGCATPPV